MLRPVVANLLATWEGWLPHVASCINGSVCESTGHSPHYIVYGQELRLQYDLDKPHPPVYNADDYGKAHFHVFFFFLGNPQRGKVTSRVKNSHGGEAA